MAFEPSSELAESRDMRLLMLLPAVVVMFVKRSVLPPLTLVEATLNRLAVGDVELSSVVMFARAKAEDDEMVLDAMDMKVDVPAPPKTVKLAGAAATDEPLIEQFFVRYPMAVVVVLDPTVQAGGEMTHPELESVESSMATSAT